MVTSTYTLPTIERLNKTSVIKRFLRESGLGFYGTATGGGTTSIVDTVRMANGGLNDDFAEGWAYILKDAGGSAAAPEGEIQPLSAFVASTGTATIGTVTAAVATGDEYAIFTVIHPQEVLDHLTELLTSEIYIPCWTVLTNIPDGDMEQSNTTDWANSNATLAKATAEPAMSGARYLSVTAGAANAYATPAANISVLPNKKYHLSALVRTDAATSATLSAYDITNSASIDSVTYAGTGTQRLWMEFTTPAGCYNIKPRLTTVTDTKITYWDDVVLYGLDDVELPGPWWAKDSDQIKGVFQMRPFSTGTNTWDATLRGERDTRWDFRDDSFGRGQLTFVSRYGTANSWPVYVKGTRNETAFSNNNSDYKHLDPNLINAGLCFKAFSALSSYRNAGSTNMEWIRERRAFWEGEWKRLRRDHALRLEGETTSIAPMVPFYRNRDRGSWYEDRRVR